MRSSVKNYFDWINSMSVQITLARVELLLSRINYQVEKQFFTNKTNFIKTFLSWVSVDIHTLSMFIYNIYIIYIYSLDY